MADADAAPETRETRRQADDETQYVQAHELATRILNTWACYATTKRDSKIIESFWAELAKIEQSLPAALPASPVGAREGQDKTQHWSVTVTRNGDELVTIESNMLTGKPEFSEADADTIRNAAEHLVSFIGRPIAAPEGQEAETPQEQHHEQCPWHRADPERLRSVCGCPEGWPKPAAATASCEALVEANKRVISMIERLESAERNQPGGVFKSGDTWKKDLAALRVIRDAILALSRGERTPLEQEVARLTEELRIAQKTVWSAIDSRDEAEAELAVLRGERTETPRWEPMATAPKDGRPVVLYTGAWLEPNFVTAVWDNGWRIGRNARIEPESVTHWLPLPAAPSTGPKETT